MKCWGGRFFAALCIGVGLKVISTFPIDLFVRQSGY